MKKFFVFLSIELIAIFSWAEKVQLKFKHSTGDAFSYVSKVDEEVLVNGKFSHTAKIVNRISAKVKKSFPDGKGLIEASYMITENSTSLYSTVTWGDEFNSEFMRAENGEMEIEDTYFMPTVRNIPVFPDYQIEIGDTWMADGMEAEDLRKTFNVEKPFLIPFTAKYKYLRDEEIDDKKLNVIQVEYNFYYESPEPVFFDGYLPASTMGNSKQIIFWDNEKGSLDHYTENFKIIIENFYGDVFIFQGKSEGEVTEIKTLNNDENLRQIEKSVNQLALENVSVKKSEKGLTISLDNIQFEADSARLLPSERQKLKKLSSLLLSFPNDLLITGHCADRGSASARQKLSEERAETVAKYLQTLGVRSELHIFTTGKGSSEPVASNDTEKGRALNRRVEITILE